MDKSLDVDSKDVMRYVKEHDEHDTQWGIYLPDYMLLKSVAWFYQVLRHPGASRLYKMMSQHFYNNRLRHRIDTFKCDQCQKYKLPGKG